MTHDLELEDELSYSAAYIESIGVLLSDMDEANMSRENVLRLYAIEHLIKGARDAIQDAQKRI